MQNEKTKNSLKTAGELADMDPHTITSLQLFRQISHMAGNVVMNI